MEYVDYYKVLGVDRSAKLEEITKSYKKLARQYHPDLNKSPNAEKMFKELNEAYEVLKDPETRKRYDMLGANWKHGAHFDPPSGWGGPGVHFEFRNGGSGGSGFSDFFESIFGNRGGPKRSGIDDLFNRINFGGNGQPQTPRGRDVESELTISLKDSYLGSKRTVTLSGPSGKRKYDVKIPRGVRSGESIRLTGQGLGHGANKGDLYLNITIAPDPQFKLEGDDLVVAVPVAAWDAALGCKLNVPTIDGSVTMTVPKGLSSGQRLRIKGKGLPNRSGGQGDLFAELKIMIPKELTREQERLFLKLRRLSGE